MHIILRAGHSFAHYPDHRLHNKHILVGWLVGWFVGWLVRDHLLLRDFGSYAIIFMNVCVVIIVAMVMLLRYSGPFVSICRPMWVVWWVVICCQAILGLMR
jgi:hypothetical protein